MKVKALSAFCYALGKDVYPGEVFEVSDYEALVLVSRGRVTADFSDADEQSSGAAISRVKKAQNRDPKVGA